MLSDAKDEIGDVVLQHLVGARVTSAFMMGKHTLRICDESGGALDISVRGFSEGSLELVLVSPEKSIAYRNGRIARLKQEAAELGVLVAEVPTFQVVEPPEFDAGAGEGAAT